MPSPSRNEPTPAPVTGGQPRSAAPQGAHEHRAAARAERRDAERARLATERAALHAAAEAAVLIGDDLRHTGPPRVVIRYDGTNSDVILLRLGERARLVDGELQVEVLDLPALAGQWIPLPLHATVAAWGWHHPIVLTAAAAATLDLQEPDHG